MSTLVIQETTMSSPLAGRPGADPYLRSDSFAQPGFGDDAAALLRRIEASCAPPPQFAAAVRQLAEWLNLDADELLGGKSFEVRGLQLALVHYGTLDADGATLAIDFGDFPREKEAAVMRQLLEHNLMTAGARHGFFAVAPGSNRMQFCMRVALDDDASRSAEAIGDVILMAVQSMQSLCRVFMDQIQDMDRMTAGTADRMVS
jgi:hypothetical protein